MTKKSSILLLSLMDSGSVRCCMKHCGEDNEAVFRVSGRECPDSLAMSTMVEELEVIVRDMPQSCQP